MTLAWVGGRVRRVEEFEADVDNNNDASPGSPIPVSKNPLAIEFDIEVTTASRKAQEDELKRRQARKVFVSGIPEFNNGVPKSASEASLTELFESYGLVESLV